MSDHVTKFKPLSDRIIVKLDQVKAIGQVLLPDNFRNEAAWCFTGVIVAQGPGKEKPDGTREPMQTKVGDRVIFSKYAGNEVHERDTELRFILQTDVMCVVE